MDQRTIQELEAKQLQMEKGYFTVRSNRKISKIAYDELEYIESLADYIRLHLAHGIPINTKEKISHMEKELPGSFLRIHRSFIVNTTKISSFSRESVLIGEKELPISRSYKKVVVAKLNNQ